MTVYLNKNPSVVNVSQIVQYREQVGGQKIKEAQPVEVEEIEE